MNDVSAFIENSVNTINQELNQTIQVFEGDTDTVKKAKSSLKYYRRQRKNFCRKFGWR